MGERGQRTIESLRTILLALAVFVALCGPTRAALDVLAGSDGAPIGRHAAFLVEGATRLGLEGAIDAHRSGKFTSSTLSALNFGIGSNPVWLRFEVSNPSETGLLRRLVVETSWLERVEVFFLRDGRLLDRQLAGDSIPFADRPTDHRFFAFDHRFAVGSTEVFIRIETADPMPLPIYLRTVEADRTHMSVQGYAYGLIYGAILALAAYNAALFIGLGASRYLYYAVYITLFVAMNVSYTGHGFQWLWPSSPRWQQWSNPTLMLAYAVAGVLFAARFLDLKQNFPKVYGATLLACATFAALIAFGILLDRQAFTLFVAFWLFVPFTGSMLIFGVISLRAGVQSAGYFLLAVTVAMIGAGLTAAAVWGLIPYTIWAYHAIEIGMVLDAVLLALALADQFRVSQEKRIRAEEMAKTDPLTGLNNRRGFQQVATLAWRDLVRGKRHAAVIALDIDHFKKLNDTYGHGQGDLALIEVANLLERTARVGDILARWGGEEFLLLLPDAKSEEAVRVAERIRALVASVRISLEWREVGFTVSLGVVSVESFKSSLDNLIAEADRRLYRAKEAGRDRVCAAPSLSDEVVRFSRRSDIRIGV